MSKTSEELMEVAVGVIVGIVQTALAREYLDKKYPNKKVDMLKDFGRPAALLGLGTGITATGAALYQTETKGRADTEERLAFGYGISALVTGAISGFSPAVVTETPPATAITGGVRRVVGGAVIEPGVDVTAFPGLVDGEISLRGEV